MKKLFSLALLAAWLLSGGVAFAGVGWQESGGAQNPASQVSAYGCTQSFDGFTETMDCRTISGTTVTTTGALTFQTNIVARGGVAASTLLQSSSTVLGPSSLPYSLVLKNVGAGTAGLDTQDGGTRLVNGTDGKTLTFLITSLGGSSYWDLTPVTTSGFTALRFDTQGDMATLAYINSTLGWVLVANGGTVVTTRKWGTTLNPSGF